MRLKFLVVTLSGLFMANAFADDSSLSSSIDAQIGQLQQQINQLQAQMKTNAGNVSNIISSDSAAPLGLLPDTGLSYALLQEQNQLNSLLVLGGYLEADAQVWGGSSDLKGVVGGSRAYPNSGTDVALTSAKLYILTNPNNWTQGFMTVEGGLNGAQTNFSEAFLTFGNLSKTPFYLTLGKTYLPFGVYAGDGLWANTLLTNAFRPAEINQLDLGFGKGNFNTNLALFNGQNNLNDFIYSVQYSQSVGQFSLAGGAGYMNDIRYSGSGVGSAYANNVNGYTSSQTVTGSRNGAVDVNGGITFNVNAKQSVGLNGEWNTTTSSALYNGVDTGKMQAWSAAANFNTPVYGKATTFALDYSATINMQNIALPLAGAANTQTPSIIGAKSQWLVSAQTEVVNNFFIGPEFARMKMASGQYTWESTLDASLYF